jgi:DNA repair exonuclease SbcCD ATPase subunit
MATNKELATDLELLKKDITSMSGLMSKLDLAIEKLTDVANSLDRVIAVHENRLEYHDQIDKELFTLIEDRRKEAKEQYELLHKRMGSMRDDLEESIEDSIKEMLSDIKEMKEKDAEHHKEVSDRLTKLEMWKWYVIGMATLAGFIFSLLPDFIT